MSGPYSLFHWSDDYAGTVVYIGPRCRIAVNRHGFGWDVQTTPRKATSGRQWATRASLIRSRQGLSRIVLDHLTWPLSTKDSNILEIYGLPCDSSGLIRGDENG